MGSNWNFQSSNSCDDFMSLQCVRIFSTVRWRMENWMQVIYRKLRVPVRRCGMISTYMSPLNWKTTIDSKTKTISSIRLIEHNKRFLHLTTGAPGITYDARLLFHTTLFRQIENDATIPNKTIDIGEAGEILLVTPGDSTFPRLPWLIKGFNENTHDPKRWYFNKKLCSVRAVTENVYGMLKGHWRLIYKKCECKLHIIKYVVMAAVVLHNLCIHTNDPCKPRWKISVENIEFTDKSVCRKESRNTKFISQEISQNICDWLWSQQ